MNHYAGDGWHITGFSTRVVVCPEEEGGFSVFALMCPGCVSQGETVEESLEHIAEALQLWCEAHIRRSMVIPWGDAEVDRFGEWTEHLVSFPVDVFAGEHQA